MVLDPFSMTSVILKGSRTTSSYDSVVATSTGTMRRVGMQQKKAIKAPAAKRTTFDTAQCRMLHDMQSTDDESTPAEAKEEQPSDAKCEGEAAPGEVASEAEDADSRTDEGESEEESDESCRESSGGGAPATSPTVREAFDLREVAKTPVAPRDTTPPKAPSAEAIGNSPLTVANDISTPAKKETEPQLKTPSGSNKKMNGGASGSKKNHGTMEPWNPGTTPPGMESRNHEP